MKIEFKTVWEGWQEAREARIFITFTDDNGKTEQKGFFSKVTKKGIANGQIYGYKFKIDLINRIIFDIQDVSTIRNGTAKICEYLKTI